jgi:hypothetical protein
MLKDKAHMVRCAQSKHDNNRDSVHAVEKE